MKEKFKDNKGFTGTDAMIAILIITLFTGLIATISYNIYLSNSSLKRISTSNEYIVSVFEDVEKMDYENVTAAVLAQHFNNKYYDSEAPKAKANDENENTPFKITINVVQYSKMPGNEEKLDLIKEVTMSVEYKLGNKNQKIEMSRIKTRENIENLNSIQNIEE